MQRGTLRNLFLDKLRERMAGATTLSGRLLSWLLERSRTVRQGDHSAISGILVSLLLERLSSSKLGSSRRHFGIVTSSLCWRSIFTTYRNFGENYMYLHACSTSLILYHNLLYPMGGASHFSLTKSTTVKL